MPPLADRMRPKKLDEYIGQKQIVGSDKLLYKTIKSGQIFSMLFWGPPGTGKTTLARVIANEVEADFMEFSAVTTGIADLKKIFEKLYKGNASTNAQQINTPLFPERSETESKGKKTIIFIDEIHRFNKAQQDAFLPYVENGTIILIGATTENPSFEVISALLSRTRVFVLNQLTRDEMEEVVNRALKDKINGFGNLKIKLSKDALDFLLEGSNGDARIILNTLEIAVLGRHSGKFTQPESDPGGASLPRMTISKNDIEEALQKRALSYDKGGEEHYNTISAFIKSMRASQVDSALYYLARMIEAGEDPLFIARRMVIFASEDIGMALPTALVVANQVFEACEKIGLPECQINLAHGVTYLCLAKKDRSSYEAYFEALEDVKKFGNLPIPMNVRNAPTKLMKEIGYGKGYKMYSNESFLPEKLKNKRYYKKS